MEYSTEIVPHITGPYFISPKQNIKYINYFEFGITMTILKKGIQWY